MEEGKIASALRVSHFRDLFDVCVVTARKVGSMMMGDLILRSREIRKNK